MKIAVYARSLVGQPTGRGSFAAQLIDALAKSRDDELHVFSGAGEPIEGVQVHSARTGSKAGDAVHFARGFGAELRRLRPDVLWCTTHLVPLGLPDGLPVVATVLDLVWRDEPGTMRRRNRLASRLLERRLSRADRVACISRFTEERALAHLPALSGRTAVVHLAPDARLAALPDSPDSPDSPESSARPFLVTVGTLEPRKNFSLLLDAMRALPELELVHCGGSGWKSRELDEAFERLPNAKRLGYVPLPKLAALYRNAAAAVFPSIYEGFHLPPLDAASLGCPLVVSDIPTHREVLGEGARYFPPDDASALAAAVRSTVAERAPAVERARRAAARYDWEKSASTLRREFERAKESRRERRAR